MIVVKRDERLFRKTKKSKANKQIDYIIKIVNTKRSVQYIRLSAVGKWLFRYRRSYFLISFYIMMSDCFVSDKMIFYICLKSVGFNRFGIRIAGK